MRVAPAGLCTQVRTSAQYSEARCWVWRLEETEARWPWRRYLMPAAEVFVMVVRPRCSGGCGPSAGISLMYGNTFITRHRQENSNQFSSSSSHFITAPPRHQTTYTSLVMPPNQFYSWFGFICFKKKISLCAPPTLLLLLWRLWYCHWLASLLRFETLCIVLISPSLLHFENYFQPKVYTRPHFSLPGIKQAR